MSNVIDVTRASNGGVIITINNIPRAISEPINVQIKEVFGIYQLTGVSQLYGIICKADRELFRLQVNIDDTLTINGVAAGNSPANWINLLNQFIFGGVTTYAAPAKINQTITFPLPAGRVHTAPPFSAGASVDSGLPLAYVSGTPAIATVNATTGLITPLTAGSTVITVSQAGNSLYNAAASVPQTLVLS